MSPWPGKCFTVGITPAASLPAAKAAPKIPDFSGSEPKERVPIIVESKFVNKSTVGAKFILIPRHLISFEI